MKQLLTPLAAAAAIAVAGCASPTAPTGDYAGVSAAASSPRQCFWTRNVDGFAAVDDDTVNLRVGVNDIYQMELLGPCPDIDWAQRIALESRGGSSICTGLDAMIIAPSPIGPMRCPVRTVRRLTDAEVAALDSRQRP